MAKLSGTLSLHLTDAGNFQRVFTLNEGQGTSRPLLAKDSGAMKSDLVSSFEFTPTDASAFIAEVERNREADRTISIDEGLALKLVEKRR